MFAENRRMLVAAGCGCDNTLFFLEKRDLVGTEVDEVEVLGIRE
jgi:hypothetical protein